MLLNLDDVELDDYWKVENNIIDPVFGCSFSPSARPMSWSNPAWDEQCGEEYRQDCDRRSKQYVWDACICL